MYGEISFPGLGLSFNPSRVAFSIGSKAIYWYGIIIAVGFLLAVFYA
jgi:phosphatidylglycerol:prolipoprotein diacylglycerol transferase